MQPQPVGFSKLVLDLCRPIENEGRTLYLGDYLKDAFKFCFRVNACELASSELDMTTYMTTLNTSISV